MDPVSVLLCSLPAVGSLIKVLSTRSETVQLNPGQSYKTKPCAHMRWEPIEIPTKRELSGRQQFQVFGLVMQNTQPSEGEVSFGEKS